MGSPGSGFWKPGTRMQTMEIMALLASVPSSPVAIRPSCPSHLGSWLRQELWSQPASTIHQLNDSPLCASQFPSRKQRCNSVCFTALLGELSDTMHWPSPGDAEKNKAISVPKEDTAWQERLTQNPPGLVNNATSGPEMFQSRGPQTVTCKPSTGLYLLL